jgi:hypothetical protein
VQAEQLVRLDWLPLAFQPQRPQLSPGRDVPGGRRRARPGVHRADGGGVGQPGGGVDGVADDRVLQRGLDAGHHLAGVEPDPQPERRAATALVVQHPTHGPLHGQRGPYGPLGVVLVRDRGTEDRHDPVAGQLVHVPAEGLDRAGQGGQHPVGDGADPLRVQVLRPGGEIGQVAEQDGDHPALRRG